MFSHASSVQPVMTKGIPHIMAFPVYYMLRKQITNLRVRERDLIQIINIFFSFSFVFQKCKKSKQNQCTNQAVLHWFYPACLEF